MPDRNKVGRLRAEAARTGFTIERGIPSSTFWISCRGAYMRNVDGRLCFTPKEALAYLRRFPDERLWLAA